MTDSFNPAVGFAPRELPEAPRDSLIAGLFAALAEGDAASHRYLLLLRFAVLNLVAAALLGAAWLKGWVPVVLAGDTTHLVLVICAVFAFGLFSCGRKIWQTSTEINQLKERPPGSATRIGRYLASVQGRDGHARSLAASALKLKLAARIASVRHLANSLVLLGLIGTVVGFIMALSGVNAATAADVEAIGPMVSTLISGMSVALYTTLVGAVLNIWLMTNYRLLEGGTVTLVTAIVEERWPDELDCDVDLWVEAPGDVPVGYSNKGGVTFNLLRDDLGKRADATGMNYEVSYSRGIPAGEYTVNLHLYRNTTGVLPVPVTVVTSVKKSSKESARQLLASNVELVREGEELTVYRFKLSADGDLVPGSVHSLQRKLRTWRSS